MQDMRDGSMVPLDPKLFDALRGTNGGEAPTPEALVPVGEAAGIPRQQQGGTLCVGEIIRIKGGNFRVASFGRKFVQLEGMPGTVITKVEEG